MAVNQTASVTLAAASANNIALSQTPGGAVAMTLNGSTVASGVAVLDAQRRVLITSAANDSGITFTIAGANRWGNPISEVLTGANASTAQSVLDYKTVTSVTTSGAAAGAVTVGTSGVGSSGWIMLNPHAMPFNVSLAVVFGATGAPNATVQYTYDSPNDPSGAVPTAWATAIAGKTVNSDTTLGFPVRAVRLLMNSGTGTATLTVIQAGITA